jgi:hypothetical protein
MRHSPEPLLHILLALLLLLSPLQRVMAGVMPGSVQTKAIHVMSHGDADTLAMHDTQAMSSDCPQCTEHGGCDDSHGCNHVHCASCCVPGMLSHVYQLLTPVGSIFYAQTDDTFVDRHTSHPFRPPKS